MRFHIKQNDTRAALKASFFDAENNPVDLTECKVYFILADSYYKVMFKREVTLLEGNKATVVFLPEDTSRYGIFKAEFEVVYPDGRIETFPQAGYIDFYIEKDLG